MINIDSYDLNTVESVYIVANTPMYIVRNLSADDTVRKIALSHCSSDLINALKVCLQSAPTSSKERAWPFALLIALGLKQDRTAILEAAEIPSVAYRWYKPVAEALLHKIKHTSVTTINVDGPKLTASTPVRSTVRITQSSIAMGAPV